MQKGPSPTNRPKKRSRLCILCRGFRRDLVFRDRDQPIGLCLFYRFAVLAVLHDFPAGFCADFFRHFFAITFHATIVQLFLRSGLSQRIRSDGASDQESHEGKKDDKPFHRKPPTNVYNLPDRQKRGGARPVNSGYALHEIPT